MKKTHKLYWKLFGSGVVLILAGAGMLAVDWLQIPGAVLLLAGIALLVAAQIYWWIFA